MGNRIKDEFTIAARQCIRNNNKLMLVKLALDVRTHRVLTATHPDFIEYRSLKELYEFIKTHFETKYITAIWNYARGNNLTPTHGVVVRDIHEYKNVNNDEWEANVK